MIDRFIRLKEKLHNYLIDGSNLQALSGKLHVLVVSILLAQNIPILYYRYAFADFPMVFTWINIAEISIYILSLVLFYINKRDFSICAAAFGIPLIFIYILYFLGYDIGNMFKNSFWFLLCFMLIYIVIMRKKIFRYTYIIFCLAIYFIPGSIIAYDYPEDLIKIIQILTLLFIPYVISTFIEKQDGQIFYLNKNLKLRLQEKEGLTKKLKSKNEELITFSHIMTHDLKSPLKNIIALSGLIKKQFEFDNQEQKKYFTYMQESAISMSGLIDDLIAFSKIESEEGKLKLIELNTVIEDVKSHCEFDLTHKNVKLKFLNLPVIYGNRQMLKTLFNNLISNSIKYQPKDQSNHIPSISISHIVNECNYYILIEDNGIGIKSTNKEELFEPFKRFHSNAEYEGTGLGLSICKKVMDKHSGTIKLKSTSENGSTFELSFPKPVQS